MFIEVKSAISLTIAINSCIKAGVSAFRFSSLHHRLLEQQKEIAEFPKFRYK
jgi:hypothetical protein